MAKLDHPNIVRMIGMFTVCIAFIMYIMLT